jgi:glycosyltransferase involved in cell wall biosynthesis
VAHEHFIDPEFCRNSAGMENIDHTIGFIGRLEVEKGILNLLRSLEFPEMRVVTLLIAGDGPLTGEIKRIIHEGGNGNRIRLVGWVDHDMVCDILKSIRLLVVPSMTEGLPNIVLESMSCGTPVLATSVGGIPDLIIDNVTGFILTDDSPQSICTGIIRALKSDRIDSITLEARNLVSREFTKNVAVEHWRSILDSDER